MGDIIYEDISVEEENQLPLPEGWMKVIKYLGGRNKDGSINNLTIRMYKNTMNQQEITEHPLILKAINKANKSPLPKGWNLIQENVNGKTEIFYVNPELQLSMWDPPQLRSCLIKILKESGYPEAAAAIANPQAPLPEEDEEQGEEEEEQDFEENREFFEERKTNSPSSSSPVNRIENRNYLFETPQFELFENDFSLHGGQYGETEEEQNLPSFIESPILQFPQAAEEYPLPEDEGDESEGAYVRNKSKPFGESETTGITENNNPRDESKKDRDWNSLLQTFREPVDEYTEKVSHRITEVPPPMTSAGITILKTDIVDANERVHQLLLKLRAMMTEKVGYQCSFLYYDEKEGSSSETNGLVTLASDIITLIRQQPDYIIMTLSYRNLTQSLEMLEIAFIMIHRVLHPFSTDNSMTTALLLQSINYQLEELSEVENIFSVEDSKLIISRAMFIHNAKQAIEWNGLWTPVPVVPNVQRETVFACLMRVYALRRDVTGYFRAIWRPLLPSIAALFTSSEELSNPVLFTNIITLAHRFLATTYSEKSMTVFPVTATAVSRAIYEIAGQETLLTFTFNFLILPNLIKIVCGDHDSLENEQYHSLSNLSKIMNKYYDQRWWFQNEDMETSPSNRSNGGKPSTKSQQQQPHKKNAQRQRGRESSDNAAFMEDGNSKSLKIIRSFIYMIWKLFSCSVYLNDSMITAISMSEFLQDHLQYLNPTGHTDSKLRNLIMRLKTKLRVGCSWLVKMPLDAQGSEYLGITEQPETSNYYKDLYHSNHPNPSNPKTSQETCELLDRRIAFLAFKPNEILNLSVISKTELTRLLTDIAVAIENCVQPAHSPSSTSTTTNTWEEITKSNISPELLADLHPIYQLIREFLSLYDSFLEGTASNNNNKQEEQFLQLSFLYDKIALPPVDDEEYLAYEYKQMIRGLKLMNRYEDTLIHLISKSEKKIISNIFELLADHHCQWYLEPEFDTEFKIHHIEIAEKHTEGSRKKIRHPQYGLRKQPMIQIFPLFSQHNEQDLHPNHRSLISLQKDVIASYRFGSAQRSVDVGTSLARQRVLPPKLQRGQIKVTTVPQDSRSEGSNRLSHYSSNHQNHTNNNANNNGDGISNHSNRNRSTFTEPTIQQNASILAPTQSFIHSKIPKKYEKPTLKDKDQKFMKEMRGYEVIPTHEFQMRYFRRKSKRRGYHHPHASLNRGDNNDDPNYDDPDYLNEVLADASKSLSPYSKRKMRMNKNNNNGNAKPLPIAPPKPFPEHLRNRIRGNAPKVGISNNQSDQQQQQFEDEYPTDYYTSDQGGDEQGYDEEDGENIHHQGNNSNQLNPDFFSQLIQDYQAAVKPLKESAMHLNELLHPEERVPETTENEEMDDDYRYAPQQRGRSPSVESSRQARARSPRMPSPIAGSSQGHSLLSPTASVLNRFKSIDQEPSNQYMRDLGFGAPPELRKYEKLPESAIHPEPFKPTKSKFYPAAGPRIPRVPDFLSPIEGEDVIYTNSRSSSPRGNRSRSSSPAASRSRSSGHARPTISSLNQRSDRAVLIEQQLQQENPHEADGAIEQEEPSLEPAVPAASEENISKEKKIFERKVSPPLQEQPLQEQPLPQNPKQRGLQITAEPGIPVRTSSQPEMAKTPVFSTANPVLSTPTRISSKLSVEQVQLSPPLDPLPRKKLNLHKFSFAEALASASAEAAEQHKKIQQDSSYSFSYVNEEETTRNRVNLSEDRELALNKLKAVFTRRIVVEEEEEKELNPEENMIEFPLPDSPSRSAKSRKSARFQFTEEDESERKRDPSPNKIPIVRKKSLISDGQEGKELFLRGFSAIKHGRSGQPKRKTIKYNEEEKTISWSSAERRSSSFIGFFNSKSNQVSAINVLEIIEIKKGNQTDVFQKGGLLDPTCCFSIVTPDRTLDLVMDSQSERSKALKGLQIILDTLNVKNVVFS